MALNVIIVFEGVRLPLTLHRDANIFDLKQLLQTRTGVPPKDQRLVGFEIDDLDDIIPLDAVLMPKMVLHLEDARPKNPKGPTIRPPSGPASPNIRLPGNHHPGRSEPPRKTPPPSRAAGKLLNIGLLDRGQQVLPGLQTFFGVCEVDTDFFVQTFETKYGYDHPPFTCGAWNSFFEQEVRRKNKYFVVSLHDEDNSDNTYFSSLVLSRKEVGKFFTDENIRFWVGVLSPETRQEYQRVFQTAMKFPAIFLLSNVNNSLVIIDIIKELMTPLEFRKRLSIGKEHHNYLVAQMERITAEQEAKRQELLAQQMAFEQSANEDRAKQELKELADILKDSKREAIAAERQELIQRFSALPEFTPSEQEPRGINLGLRLPDGGRVNRVFSASSKFQHVLDWVSGLVAQKLTDETFLDDESAPIDSLGPDGDEEASVKIKPWTISAYALVARGRAYTVSDSASTLGELGITPQMLLLQRIE